MAGALPVSMAGSIGVMPSSETGFVKILKVAANSPAEGAGLKSGDSITKINDQSVTNWSDARRLLFGRAGTAVKVTYQSGSVERSALMMRSLTVQNNLNAEIN